MGTTTTVRLQLTITDTHITLTRSEPDALLASMLLDVMRCDPGAQAAWRQLCGSAIAAVALDVSSPATAKADVGDRPHIAAAR